MEQIIIKYLLAGKTQAEISNILKSEGIEPNSLSSIEKKLKKIRLDNNAKTMFHLGAILAKKNA